LSGLAAHPAKHGGLPAHTGTSLLRWRLCLRSEGTLVHGLVRGAGCQCRFRAARTSVRLSSACATR
jgi:hypothetical protein